MRPDDLSPQSPLSFDEAAEVCLRGLVKGSTLKAAADRGELAAERLGRRRVTTPAAIEAWRELCRDREKARACISGRPAEPDPPPNGSSETDQSRLALDAAKATARALKNGSPTTSAKSIECPAASVHFLKQESRT